MKVTKNIQGDLIVKSLDSNPKYREKFVNQAFDVEFTSLSKVVVAQSQAKHDAQMFDTIYQNIKNYLITLDTFIKTLRMLISNCF